MKVYFAGKIPKGTELDDYKNWRDEYTLALHIFLPTLEVIDPDQPVDESDPLIGFGQDCWMIKECDAILIKADHKLGVGTAQEMLIAKHFCKPVVTILPKDTHHRRTNATFRCGTVKDWIHPFVHSTSDIIVETIEEAGTWLSDFNKNPNNYSINNMEIIEDSIKHYLKKTSA